MDIVPMIIIAILIVVCPRKGTFIDAFKLRFGCIELNMSTKEKNCPPAKDDSSNQNH